MEEEIITQSEPIAELKEEPASPAEQTVAAPVEEKPSKEPKAAKPFTQWPVFGWFLNSRSKAALAGKSLLLLVIPYVYLIILCLIFDTWLKQYSAAGFILYSTIAFWLINIALIVWAIIRYTKRRKG